MYFNTFPQKKVLDSSAITGEYFHANGNQKINEVEILILNKIDFIRCRIQHAWGWCTGMTQRDVVGREVGGGFMFGIACTPMVDSCQCMAKPIQYCKIK